MIDVSVPYTEMILTVDALERCVRERGFKSYWLEGLIDGLFKQGYNMDVFFYDYNFDTNLRDNND